MALNTATKLIKPLETSSSVGMFLRDTGGCLVSRLGLARSRDEAREVGIAELSESSIFYFSAPFLAKATSGIFSKKFNLTKDEFNTPVNELKNITTDKLKSIKLAKLGQILSTFSVVLPAVFAIAPIRNYITKVKSGKENFLSVIELEKNNTNNKNNDKNKLPSFVKKTLGVSLGLLALSAGAVATAKNKNIYDKIEPKLNKFIKNFEFTKTGDLKMLHYGALIYPVSILSYFLSSRDKYEKMENARRFSITVPMMFFGEKLIQNPIYKAVDKNFKTNLFENGKIKSYKDILSDSSAAQKQLLKSKNIAQLLTFSINTVALAGAVTLLNRFETKRKFNEDKAKNGKQ